MSTESSHVPSVDELRTVALVHGVEPADTDLEAVQGFLATILPVLVEIEARQGTDTPPAGLFLPDPEAR
jgi:hypothetical protein